MTRPTTPPRTIGYRFTVLFDVRCARCGSPAGQVVEVLADALGHRAGDYRVHTNARAVTGTTGPAAPVDDGFRDTWIDALLHEGHVGAVDAEWNHTLEPPTFRCPKHGAEAVPAEVVVAEILKARRSPRRGKVSINRG